MSTYRSFVVGRITNNTGGSLNVLSKLNSGTWIKEVSSPMGTDNTYDQMFIAADANLTAGEVHIWLKGPPLQDSAIIRLIFSNEGGTNTFRTEGSIPGVMVQSTGVEPPYENHGQSLLHGRIILAKN